MPGNHHDFQVAGTVVDRQRAEHRTGKAVQFARIVADEAEAGFRAQAQGLTDPADLSPLADAMSWRATSYRLELFADRNVGPLQRHRRFAGLLDADPQADFEE